MSDLRETTGITRTPEAETISSLRADLAAERAITSKLLADKGNLSRAIFEADDAMEKLEAEVARLRGSNKELAAALRSYETWEAALILHSPAWEGNDGLPRFTQELYDSWMDLQRCRNAALAKATEAATERPNQRKGRPMILCDKCGLGKSVPSGRFPNRVIANISFVDDDGKKRDSQTIHVFQGHLCNPCFEAVASALKAHMATLLPTPKG